MPTTPWNEELAHLEELALGALNVAKRDDDRWREAAQDLAEALDRSAREGKTESGGVSAPQSAHNEKKAERLFALSEKAKAASGRSNEEAGVALEQCVRDIREVRRQSSDPTVPRPGSAER